MKRGWEKFLKILGNKFVIIAFLFIFISLATVFAGNVIVKEGSLTAENNLNVTGSVYGLNNKLTLDALNITNPTGLNNKITLNALNITNPTGLNNKITLNALNITGSFDSIIATGTITAGDNLFLAGLRANVLVDNSNANYFMTSDNFVVIDSEIGNITLPSASNAGQIVVIKRTTQPGNLIIKRAGSDTIEGTTSITLSSSYQSRTLVADGTNTWYIISST